MEWAFLLSGPALGRRPLDSKTSAILAGGRSSGLGGYSTTMMLLRLPWQFGTKLRLFGSAIHWPSMQNLYS